MMFIKVSGNMISWQDFLMRTFRSLSTSMKSKQWSWCGEVNMFAFKCVLRFIHVWLIYQHVDIFYVVFFLSEIFSGRHMEVPWMGIWWRRPSHPLVISKEVGRTLPGYLFESIYQDFEGWLALYLNRYSSLLIFSREQVGSSGFKLFENFRGRA